MSFMQAWERTVCRDGWLTEVEARALYEAATINLLTGERIVEVGAYRGKSTSLLAETGCEVITLDPLNPDYGAGNGMKIHDCDAAALQAVVDSYPNVTWLKIPSTDFHSEKQIDMLYIDGDHLHPAPLRDFRHMRKWLYPGSTVAFHDYGAFPGVTNAVNYLMKSGQIEMTQVAKTMFIGRILAPQPETAITGYNMMVLCHKFGRRARAFMRSLVEQQNMIVPMHLTFFYSDYHDLDLAFHDALLRNLPEWLTVSCQKIDPDKIMRRAELFSTHIPIHVYSHVIYTDCDLWFDPAFFASYTALLINQEPGYWSTNVYDIEEADAETLVTHWQSLNHHTLNAYKVSTPRYDWGKGTAGHFQCVPHSLANYPPAKIVGVNQADHEFANWAIGNSIDPNPERRLSCEQRVYHFGHPFSWQGTDVQL